jgi:hypothetical protein
VYDPVARSPVAPLAFAVVPTVHNWIDAFAIACDPPYTVPLAPAVPALTGTAPELPVLLDTLALQPARRKAIEQESTAANPFMTTPVNPNEMGQNRYVL